MAINYPPGLLATAGSLVQNGVASPYRSTSNFNIPSMLGFLSSGISTLGNFWSNNKQQALAYDNMANQWKMMQSNQNFNRYEAMAARSWQEKMVSQYRQYNSPSEQMKRFEEAGLNPALMYGSIQDTNMSPTGNPQASDGGSYSPVSMPLNNYADTAMQMAQIDVLKSQADKNRADAGLSVADTETTQQLRDGLVKTQYAEWILKGTSSNWNEQQIKESARKMDEMNENMKVLRQMVEESKSRVDNLEEDTVSKSIDNVYKSSWWNEQIRQLSTQADLNTATTRKIVLLMALEAANIQSDTSNKLAQSLLAGKLGSYYDSMRKSTDTYRLEIIPRLKTSMVLQNNTLYFDLGQAKKFNTAERIVNMVSQGTSAVGSLLFGGAQLSKLLPSAQAIRNGSQIYVP